MKTAIIKKPTTEQQNQIILYLYQFRYLIVSQLLKLLNHKDPRRIQEWLNDLLKRKYIAQIKNEEISMGFIYCLDTKARSILKKDEDISASVLGRLYKEKQKDAIFIKRHLFIAQIHLYFLSQKEEGQELNFFTAQELRGFEDFPELLPSAYIEVADKKETTRYFLDYFDEYTPAFVIRKRVKFYIQYLNIDWQAKIDNVPPPSILFVLPTEKMKKHIQIYTREVFKKNLADDIELFLTTKSEIKTGQVKWEEVK